MSGLSPVELYDVLDRAIHEAQRVVWPSRKQPVAWFNTATIRINGRVWDAVAHEGGDHGYNLIQARQMRAALLPLLAEYLAAATRIAKSV